MSDRNLDRRDVDKYIERDQPDPEESLTALDYNALTLPQKKIVDLIGYSQPHLWFSQLDRRSTKTLATKGWLDIKPPDALGWWVAYRLSPDGRAAYLAATDAARAPQPYVDPYKPSPDEYTITEYDLIAAIVEPQPTGAGETDAIRDSFFRAVNAVSPEQRKELLNNLPAAPAGDDDKEWGRAHPNGKCAYCGRIFRTFEDVIEHIKQEHAELDRLTLDNERLTRELAASRAECEALREALKPFAETYAILDQLPDSDLACDVGGYVPTTSQMTVTKLRVHQFKSAARALDSAAARTGVSDGR